MAVHVLFLVVYAPCSTALCIGSAGHFTYSGLLAFEADTDETLGLGLKVSVSGPIPGLGLGLDLGLC